MYTEIGEGRTRKTCRWDPSISLSDLTAISFSYIEYLI